MDSLGSESIGLGSVVDADDGSDSETQDYGGKVNVMVRTGSAGRRLERTYFSKTFLRPASRESHGKTLMSFSMPRGLGIGKSMRSWKNWGNPALETVVGPRNSRLRLMRLLSSDVLFPSAMNSTSLSMSTEVYHLSRVTFFFALSSSVTF